ncbi:MAG: hypothetical protein HY817_02580 [Candidatus Abawacabacteria bacterium]|nr:hypothetical protein [Candidatus Abawacabacteria bacterium]
MFIVATISKNSYSPEKIAEIIQAGATVLRFNFSHGTPEEMHAKVQIAQAVISELGKEGEVKILADLPGSKIRLGSFAGGEIKIQAGQKMRFQEGKHSDNPHEYLAVNWEDIGKLVTVGQIVTLGDGETGFEVTELLDEKSFQAVAISTASFSEFKGINLGSVMDSVDHFTPQMLAHLAQLAVLKPEWVAFSFVNSAEYMKRAQALLQPHLTIDWQPKVVAKVETLQGVQNIADIVAAVDIVLVARGDLGLTCPIEQLGIFQKQIVKATKAGHKQVIVSTQILDSIVNFFIPSRAEVLDLTNIVLDGADGIMLAKETGISLTPGRSVTMAKKIIAAVEQWA